MSNLWLNGELVEIDELILPTIQLLNGKGYITQCCCSGHIYEDVIDTYISFNYDELSLTLPIGFVLEDDKYYAVNYKPFKKPQGSICIRKERKENLSQLEKYKEVFEANIELLKWAKKLPNLK